ncbi:outer membrane protein assembly factor BamB family protein [Catenulispora acidiphila]|nr:PQQ-binding-like beta-propeller repeat protein [Catenulispora acidiphila]
MSTPPRDEDNRPSPFAPPPQDAPPYETSPRPAPPPMHSPYRPDEEMPGQEQQRRQGSRFPGLHHGGDHGQARAQPQQQPRPPQQQRPQTPQTPPFEQRSSQGVPSGWGGSAGGYEQYVIPPPPQFSYRPETQPAPPMPLAPPKKSRRTAIIGASAAAVLVAGAVVVGVITLGGNSKQSSTSGGPTVPMSQDTRTVDKGVAAVWTAPAGGDSATVVGSWMVDDKAIVRGDATALKAYDAESGKSLWAAPAPGGPGASICAMSQVAAGKIGLVQSGPSGNCTTITAIDTDTGRQVWSTQLSAAPGAGAGTQPLMSFGGEVVAGQVGTSVTAWNAADGKQLWTEDLAKAKPACLLYQLGAKSSEVAVVENCGAGMAVAAKDPHSGRTLWTTPLPREGLDGAQITLVQPADPTIVHVASQGGERYYSFDANGKLLSAVPGTGDFGAIDLNTGPQGQQHPVAHVQDRTLVAPTADKDTHTSLVAVDLTSDSGLWRAPATPAGPVTIAALTADKVTVFESGTADTPAHLVAFATKDGTATSSGLTDPLSKDWSGPTAAAYVAGNRLIVLPAAPEKGADVVAFALR